MRILRSVVARVAVVGAVVASAVVMTAVPASAALGTLRIEHNGAVVWSKTDPPSECYPLGKDFPRPVDVYNDTDAIVFLYDNPNCAGDPDTDVWPGRSLLNYSGFISLRVL